MGETKLALYMFQPYKDFRQLCFKSIMIMLGHLYLEKQKDLSWKKPQKVI